MNCKNFVPVCITESQAKIAVDWYGLHHYELVKNGTDIGKIVSQLCPRDTARDIFHIPKDAFVILGVGRLAKVKNFPLLIDILKQVRKLNDKAILVIAGDGSERSFLQNYAKRNGVGTFTFFLGSISNVIPLYCASDVLAITSISEAFPLVFIEAQICHLRCVVSSVVPKENIITRTTKQLSAKAGLDEWVSAVMDVNYNSAVPPQLSGKDFDIHYQCNIMRNLYISGYNKTRVKDPE